MIIITSIFLIIANIYSIVGFGGGSSYIALLVLFDVPIYLIPIIALICNIIVVSGGTYRFSTQGHLSSKLVLPFIVTSIPLAYIGGRINVEPYYYQLVLATCLLIAGLNIMISLKKYSYQTNGSPNTMLALTIGAIIGFISGLVGIGGGIFLSPILYFLNWANPKRIAAACSVFILLNSVSGLIGQYHKLTQEFYMILNYWPLFVAVLLGGQLGSFLGAVKLKYKPIAISTGMLIIIVSVRLYINIF